jgi:hypothetical protein
MIQYQTNVVEEIERSSSTIHCYKRSFASFENGGIHTEVFGLQAWMAKPCLQTHLNRCFKMYMGIDVSDSAAINDAISNSEADGGLKRTKISKHTWLQMNKYLGDAEVRSNSSLIPEPTMEYELIVLRT